jgi:hypothetical protein
VFGHFNLKLARGHMLVLQLPLCVAETTQHNTAQLSAQNLRNAMSLCNLSALMLIVCNSRMAWLCCIAGVQIAEVSVGINTIAVH